MSEWISLNDDLPEIGVRVIIVRKYTDGRVSEPIEAARFRGRLFNRFGVETTATHWMPMPDTSYLK